MGPPRRHVGQCATGRELGAQRLDQVGDDGLAVADDGHVGGTVLADLRRVDIGVDDLGPGGEQVELAGDAVVETGARAINRSLRCRPATADTAPCMPGMPTC